MVEAQTHRLEITLQKIPVTGNWLVRKVQNQVFDSVFKFVCDGMKVSTKKLTKEQREDTTQCIFVKGSQLFCEQCKDSIQNIERTHIDQFVNRFSNIRMLPRSIRQRIVTIKYDPDITSFDWLVRYLATFQISLIIEVNKIESPPPMVAS